MKAGKHRVHLFRDPIGPFVWGVIVRFVQKVDVQTSHGSRGIGTDEFEEGCNVASYSLGRRVVATWEMQLEDVGREEKPGVFSLELLAGLSQASWKHGRAVLGGRDDDDWADLSRSNAHMTGAVGECELGDVVAQFWRQLVERRVFHADDGTSGDGGGRGVRSGLVVSRKWLWYKGSWRSYRGQERRRSRAEGARTVAKTHVKARNRDDAASHSNVFHRRVNLRSKLCSFLI